MTKEEQAYFDCWADERARKPLPEGMCWLTPDDLWQDGDEYDGLNREPQPWNVRNDTPRWWKIGSKHTNCKIGERVPSWTICYTPRGKR